MIIATGLFLIANCFVILNYVKIYLSVYLIAIAITSILMYFLIGLLIMISDLTFLTLIFLLILGIDSFIGGMAYLAVKQLIYIKIETSEWLIISIGLGIAIYPNLQSISFANQIIPWVLCPTIMIIGLIFQFGYRKYCHLADPTKHNPLDVILFNKFATTLPIVFGLAIAYLGLLTLLPLDWFFDNILLFNLFRKYSHGIYYAKIFTE